MSTYTVLKIIMLVGILLVVFGVYMLAVGFGLPIPNITAAVPGASVSGTELPPGLIILIVGAALALVGGMVSNKRLEAHKSGGRRRQKR